MKYQLKANKFLFLLFFLCTVFGFKLNAQVEKPELLIQILNKLEQKYEVVFTYADENIREVRALVGIEKTDLDNCLLELEKQTGLVFKRLDSRYIAIQKQTQDIIVNGYIVDKSTNEFLEGAVIYSQNNYVVSDKNGFFSIPVNLQEDSILAVRYAGYKQMYLQKEHWGSDSLTFALQADVQQIEEVVVNYIARGMDKLADGSVQLNVRNLEVLPGLSEPDVLHTVQVLPGVLSINETVSDINIRGGTNDQSLVLWDGVKLYQSGHFFGLISAFNSHLVHKTRIIKNGANSSYDEGISGIIDLGQQDYLANETEISAGVNMLSGDLIYKMPLTNKVSVVLGARHSINKLFLSPTYKSYYKRAFEYSELSPSGVNNTNSLDRTQNFSFYDVSGKLLIDFSEKDKLRLSVMSIGNSIDSEENETDTDSLFSRKSQLSQTSILAGLKFTHAWNKNHQSALSVCVSQYLLDGANISVANNVRHLQENEVTDWGTKLDSRSVLTTFLALSSGYHFKEIGVRNLDNIRNPGYFRDAKDVLRIHSLYTELESTELLKKLFFRAGVRSNYITKFEKFLFEPVFVLNYKLSKGFSIELLAEQKTQYTTQLIDYQNDFLGIEKRRWALANETSIPLLKSRQLSVGMQYNRNNFLLSLESYLKRVNGIITPSQGFQNQFQYVYAIGEYNTRGVEVLLNKRFRRSNFWANYTLAINDYLFSDLVPSEFPNNFDVRHTASFGGNVTLSRFEFSVGGNFRTGKPFTKVVSGKVDENGKIQFDVPNSSRLENYLRFDVSARYKFEVKNVSGELGASVWNISNRENVVNMYYLVNNNNEIEQVVQNSLGLTPNVNLRLRF